jgi:hypothetical protein
MIMFVGGLGAIGLGAYAAWERVSDHPMTPPRLAQNRVFLGLNVATLLVYAGLSIMFFLVPFDLVDRRGLFAGRLRQAHCRRNREMGQGDPGGRH